MKLCRGCQTLKPLMEFYVSQGRRASKCKVCVGVRHSLRKRALLADPVWRERKNAQTRQRRRVDPAYSIFCDSRQSDTRFGRVFGLTLEIVKKLIAQPCTYCGGTALRMTLDRKDNALGHTPENVVPACTRCNYVRRDMPEEAWKLVAPGMRAAREAGAFGDWTCQIHHRRIP